MNKPIKMSLCCCFVGVFSVKYLHIRTRNGVEGRRLSKLRSSRKCLDVCFRRWGSTIQQSPFPHLVLLLLRDDSCSIALTNNNQRPALLRHDIVSSHRFVQPPCRYKVQSVPVIDIEYRNPRVLFITTTCHRFSTVVTNFVLIDQPDDWTEVACKQSQK